MRLPLVYLASPYSDPDPMVRERRWAMALCAAASLMKSGERIVYSPISLTHFLPGLGLPTSWDFWGRPSLEMLERCDRLIVLCLSGWKESIGVQAEIAHAQTLRIPIYILPSCTDIDPVPYHAPPLAR